MSLASGAALRVAAQTHEPGWRMLGTLLLVGTGLGLAGAAESYQLGEGLARLRGALSDLPGAIEVLALPRAWTPARGWSQGVVMVGHHGVMVAAAVSLSQATWRGVAMRRMQGYARSVRQAVRELQRAVGDAGAGVRWYGLVVPVRRRATPLERGQLRALGVGLANPEHLASMVQPLVEEATPGAAGAGDPFGLAAAIRLATGAVPLGCRPGPAMGQRTGQATAG